MKVASILLFLVACRDPQMDTDTGIDLVSPGDSAGLETASDSALVGDTFDSVSNDDLFSCPEASVWPRALRWDDTRVGDRSSQTVLVRNDCIGEIALSVAAGWSGGSSSAFSGSLALHPLAAGETGVLELSFAPVGFTDQLGSLVLTTNDPNAPTVTVSLLGTAPADYDGDGYPDVAAGGTDCDDGDPLIHPEASEIFYDGIDQNCVEGDDDDRDGDGFGATDCDDDNPDIHPGALEVWYDGVDSDCDGASDNDADRDGFDATKYGGEDCDDADASVYVGALDLPYDGIDSDCSGGSDNDADADGFDALAYGGSDCDDTRLDVYPGAADVAYDAVDADCAGDSDFDVDRDGVESSAFGGLDCDDEDDSAHPGADDAPYDGVDSDCAGDSDFDADGDGYDAALSAGGADCDDTDARVHPGATDAWYDGEDADCAGDSDFDADRDGYDTAAYGGTDCDDSDAGTYAGAVEIWYDGEDEDCAGDDDYDADGDGYDAIAYGGTDCDDTNPSVYGGAADVAYDDLDSDCAGDSDWDADHDGVDAEDEGGTDCDDLDATISPDAAEAQNLTDDDCDGLVDEDFVSAGDVFITELMINPVAVSDPNGEWVELLNTSASTLDLQGWTLRRGSTFAVTLSSSLVIAPGERLVLGPNADETRNGGVTLDDTYLYPLFNLDDSSGTIRLLMGSTEIFGLTYGTGWDLSAGASLSLDPTVTDPDKAVLLKAWCAASSVFGDGDLGTPGDVNDICTGLDADGDGYSSLDGDCDDTDDAVGPDAVETFNGKDENCDDVIDNLDPGPASLGSLKGPSSGSYLSYNRSLSVADLDGDGAPEVITGSLYLNSNYGGVYIVDGEALTGDLVSAKSVATASILGKSVYNYLAEVGPTQGDINGDGDLDLFVAGSDYLTAAGNFAGELFFSPSALRGSISPSKADATLLSGSTAYDYAPSTLSHLDLNGDGLADIVWGNFFDVGSTTRVYYAGRAYLIDGDDLASGGAYTMKSSASMLYGDARYDYLGQNMGGGDANGDGYDDLAVAAPYNSAGATLGGTVYLVAGAARLPLSGDVKTRMSLSVSGATSDTHLCQNAIPQIADYDGDGGMDLAVATDTSGVGARAWVFAGIGDDMGSGAALTIDDADIAITDDGSAFPEADSYYTQVGQSLASGDFSGDGVTDLAVGGGFSVYTYSPYSISRGGAAWMLSLGSTGGSIDTSEAFATVGLDALAYGTGSVLASGDLLGDGVIDLIFANPWASSSAGTLWFVPF